MIRPGLYGAKATSAVLSETKQNREYVAVEFKTREGERVNWAGYFGPNQGKDGLTQTERASNTLRLLGWNGSWDDFSSCTANEVDITVKDEEYNGTVTTKVAFINKLGEGGFKVKPLEASKAKDFANRMRQETSPPRSQTRHPNAPDDDGDLPF
jgi:hypothetical protein